MFLLINIIGLIVFLGIAVLFSRDRKNIQWQSIGILVVLNLFLAVLYLFYLGQKQKRSLMVFVGKSVTACCRGLHLQVLQMLKSWIWLLQPYSQYY